MNTLIIAEAGVNHNGDLTIAKQLIDAAAAAGCDLVKFQTFKAADLVSKTAKQAEYQKINTGSKYESQYEMLKKLELSHENHTELMSYAVDRGTSFFSTAFDVKGLKYLNSLGFHQFKIPSGEITNYPYLLKIAEFGKPIILSTGMSGLAEIGAALEVLTTRVEKKDITVLHCNTEYPTPMEDVNLKAMLNIRQVFDVNIGYSDHTLGIEVPIAAVALGARVIEKHFTLDRNLKGPDHKASLEPDELKAMVTGIRNIEKAIGGSGVKELSKSEAKNKSIARKSIFLAKNVEAGKSLVQEDLTTLRPGDGLSPMLWTSIIGKTVKSTLPAGHQLKGTDLIESLSVDE